MVVMTTRSKTGNNRPKTCLTRTLTSFHLACPPAVFWCLLRPPRLAGHAVDSLVFFACSLTPVWVFVSDGNDVTGSLSVGFEEPFSCRPRVWPTWPRHWPLRGPGCLSCLLVPFALSYDWPRPPLDGDSPKR